MTGPLLVERAVIADLFASIGADGTRSVLELFISESRGYLATIAEAADPAARDRARRAAHTLKGAAGQIGAAALAAAAAAVERAADPSEVAPALDECAACTIAALHELLAEAPGR